MKGTTISWTDDTWNVSDGCTKVSPGCKHCYAERMAKRFSGPGKPYLHVINEHGRWNNTVRFRPDRLTQPMRWKKPRKIFVNSMSDLFHEDLTNQQIAAVFGVMAACHQHTFQVLTKRPERRLEWFKWVDHAAKMMAVCDSDSPWWRVLVCLDAMSTEVGAPLRIGRDGKLSNESANRHLSGAGGATWPLRNVWQGTSVENQETANQRIPWLMQTPASVRFLSMEPLLEMIDLIPWLDPSGACCGSFESCSIRQTPQCPSNALWRYTDDGDDPHLHWVIAGCESGPGARPCAACWFEELAEVCDRYRVAFFLKQAHPWVWAAGEKPPGHDRDDGAGVIIAGPGSRRKAGGVIELPYLNGRQRAKFPEGFRWAT